MRRHINGSDINEPSFLVVFCTCPDENVGEKIGRALVDKGLAACVNITGKITSFYRWKGEICREPEVLLIIKTTQASYPALQREILSLHPYEVPEIVALPIVAGSEPYLQWVKVAGKTADN